MRKKQRLKELTIKDNFMFGAVMTDPDNCKGLLELALELPIDRVEVSYEKSVFYHPEYKGVRLDVYAADQDNTRYNVEMQVEKKPALGKRSRYYQSQMDMELLLKGEDYAELPDTFVIFICDFDPFGKQKYRYTFNVRCKESSEADLEDGRSILFLSTCGKNESEVPKELVTFLKFVKADLAGSEGEFYDPYVEQLQQFIRKVKGSREMEERFMILEEMLRDERAEGREEGLKKGREEGLKKGRAEGREEGQKDMLLGFLKDLGEIPQEVQEKISGENRPEVLAAWVKAAAKADTMEDFIKKFK